MSYHLAMYPVHFEVVPGGLYLKNVLGTVFSNFRVRSFGVKSLGVFREQPLDGRGLGSGVNKSSVKIFILHLHAFSNLKHFLFASLGKPQTRTCK